MRVAGICLHVSDSGLFLGVGPRGGEREAAGAWQAEGQTWCSAEWVSAAGPCSCCGLDIILVHWPGMSHRPGALVLPLFIKQKKARKQFKSSRQQWLNWAVVALRVAKYFAHLTRWQCFLSERQLHFSVLNYNAPCISMSISCWSQLLGFPVKSEPSYHCDMMGDKISVLSVTLID